MKVKIALAVAAACLLSSIAWAGYPFISDIPNVQLNMNGSSGPMSFQVDDEETPADQLVITTVSDNQALIPTDGNYIRLGGQGKDRTVTITPVAGQSGNAVVGIIVTDTDGNNNRDSIDVVVLSNTESSQSLEN